MKKVGIGEGGRGGGERRENPSCLDIFDAKANTLPGNDVFVEIVDPENKQITQ